MRIKSRVRGLSDSGGQNRCRIMQFLLRRRNSDSARFCKNRDSGLILIKNRFRIDLRIVSESTLRINNNRGSQLPFRKADSEADSGVDSWCRIASESSYVWPAHFPRRFSKWCQGAAILGDENRRVNPCENRRFCCCSSSGGGTAILVDSDESRFSSRFCIKNR